MAPGDWASWASEADTYEPILEQKHTSPGVNEKDDSSTTQMVEIQLGEELLGLLSRRSRRRIHDIHESCNVRTKLDKMRGVLQVVGSESGIQAVRKQLESFSGPSKPVSTAVWAELMRTRMQSTTALITVATMQEETGCRVHIERSRCEVRLFGDAQGVRQASERIDELELHCVEACVPCYGCFKLPDEQLQKLAHDHRVSFFQEAHMISIYGLKDAVRKAVVSLQKAIGLRVAEPTDVLSLEENWACPSGLSVAEENRDRAATEGSKSSQPLPSTVLPAVPPQATLPQSKDTPDHLHVAAGQGAQEGARGAVEQQPFLAQTNAVHCRSGHLQCRPTCGAARFCTVCGVPLGDYGVQDPLPTPAAKRVHWEQQQQQQPQPLHVPAGRKGSGPANDHDGGARAGGIVEMDLQTTPWMIPLMVAVPYDGTMAMQGTAAQCSPSMDQWFAETGPGQMDTRILMAPTIMFAGQSAPVDATTHPSEESLPWPQRSSDSLPPMH